MNNFLRIMIVVLVAVLAVGGGLFIAGGGADGLGTADDTASVPAAVEAPAAVEESAAADPGSAAFAFSTTALDGSVVDESIFEGKSLIMVNLWEPWCGPCVGEMGDLDRLYEEYADKGFLLLGVFSTESGTANIVEKLGISYPIIRSCPEFDAFQTGYVPTSVFLDGEGNILGEAVIGSKSYEGWKAIIDSYMA